MKKRGKNMTQLKPGLRLRSAVSEVEVMIVKAEGVAALNCGGAPMFTGADGSQVAVSALADDAACQLGKRYVNKGGSVEVVCIKGGKGALEADGEVLEVKAAKALPSSD
jgi:hypothetical protein